MKTLYRVLLPTALALSAVLANADTLLDDYTVPINSTWTSGTASAIGPNSEGITRALYSSVGTNPSYSAASLHEGNGALSVSTGTGMSLYTDLNYSLRVDYTGVTNPGYYLDVATDDPNAKLSIYGVGVDLDTSGQKKTYFVSAASVDPASGNRIAYSITGGHNFTVSNFRTNGALDTTVTPEPFMFPAVLFGIGGLVARRLRRKDRA